MQSHKRDHVHHILEGCGVIVLDRWYQSFLDEGVVILIRRLYRALGRPCLSPSM